VESFNVKVNDNVNDLVLVDVVVIVNVVGDGDELATRRLDVRTDMIRSAPESASVPDSMCQNTDQKDAFSQGNK
jgi:hypothetical protein